MNRNLKRAIVGYFSFSRLSQKTKHVQILILKTNTYYESIDTAFCHATDVLNHKLKLQNRNSSSMFDALYTTTHFSVMNCWILLYGR